MVQVIFESSWELVTVILFAVAYGFNKIYYGESPSSRIDAITVAAKGILNQLNAIALMWRGENVHELTNDVGQPLPKPNVINKMDDVLRAINMMRDEMLFKIESVNAEFHQMREDVINRVDSLEKRLVPLEEHHRKVYSESSQPPEFTEETL